MKNKEEPSIWTHMDKARENQRKRRSGIDNKDDDIKESTKREGDKRSEKAKQRKGVSFKRRRPELRVISSDEDGDYVDRRPVQTVLPTILPSSALHPLQRLKKAMRLENSSGRISRGEKTAGLSDTVWKGTPFRRV